MFLLIYHSFIWNKSRLHASQSFLSLGDTIHPQHSCPIFVLFPSLSAPCPLVLSPSFSTHLFSFFPLSDLFFFSPKAITNFSCSLCPSLSFLVLSLRQLFLPKGYHSLSFPLSPSFWSQPFCIFLFPNVLLYIQFLYFPFMLLSFQ